MRQPHVAKEPIVSLLVQDELTVPSQTGIHLAVAVEVWSVMPTTVVIVEE